MSIPLSDLARRVGAELHGDGSVVVSRVGTLESAGPEAIAFLSNPRYRRQLEGTRAGAVILAPAMIGATTLPKLVSSNPYATYAKVANVLHPPPAVHAGVHASAVVASSARVSSSASIGANAVIGERADIGDRVNVGAGSVVGDDVHLGEGTWLHANVTIYPSCIVGQRVIIHSGAVIGADGFGMAEDSGRWIKIPQIGRVVIGNDVEIGANTTIDRGAIDDTVIEDDVKLDNLIQIAHNCRIGRHTAMAGCTGVAGSTTIGANCRFGGSAMISGHITIVDGVTVSGATPIFESIDKPGVYTAAVPPLPHREWLRWIFAVRKLVGFESRLRSLESAKAAAGSERQGPR